MQFALRKLYLSVMMSILVIITAAATTYAWIGLNSFSGTEEFEIGLQAQKLADYGIEVSLTGEEGTFSSQVDSTELRRRILLNRNIRAESFSRQQVNRAFDELALAQCTTLRNGNNLTPFWDLEGQTTDGYFQFDLYIAPYQVSLEDDSGEERFLDAYLKGDLLTGKVNSKSVVNPFTYPADVWDGKTISGIVKVNSASASRVAIQKYNVVEKFHPEQYQTTQTIQNMVIFQGGTQNPYYDADSDVYSFGGILEDSKNLALYNYNSIHKTNKTVPQAAISRGDIEYTENYHIIDSSDEKEKIGANQMMKMTITFWFEGWDSDCFEIIHRMPTALNLTFGITEEDEE